MSEKLNAAIQSLKPGSEYVFQDSDYSTIEWFVLKGDAPTLKELEAEMLRLEKANAEAIKNKAATKAALLDRLGITEEEARLLLS